MNAKTCKQIEISCENWSHRKSGTRMSPAEIKAIHIARLEGEAFNIIAERHERTKYAIKTAANKITENYGYDKNGIRRIGGNRINWNLECKDRKNFTWRKHEVRFVIGRRKLGFTYKQIAKCIGRTENAVKEFFKKYKNQNGLTLFDASTTQFPKPVSNSEIKRLMKQNNQTYLNK